MFLEFFPIARILTSLHFMVMVLKFKNCVRAFHFSNKVNLIEVAILNKKLQNLEFEGFKTYWKIET